MGRQGGSSGEACAAKTQGVRRGRVLSRGPACVKACGWKAGWSRSDGKDSGSGARRGREGGAGWLGSEASAGSRLVPACAGRAAEERGAAGEACRRQCGSESRCHSEAESSVVTGAVQLDGAGGPSSEVTCPGPRGHRSPDSRLGSSARLNNEQGGELKGLLAFLASDSNRC